MAMTDEEKKARARERAAANRAAKKAQAAKAEEAAKEAEKEPADIVSETESAAEKAAREQNELLQKQIEMLKMQIAAMSTPTIVQVADNEKVRFLWQAEVADDNVVSFGDGGMFGRITGKSGSFYVPKSDLSRLIDNTTRRYLDDRWLIVVSGMTDEEREAYGVAYKDGEILDNGAFSRLVELGDELLDIYPQLCKGHKEFVAKRYNEAYEAGSPYVTRERAVALNRMSKEAGSKNGDFAAIIEKMNERDKE